ncbi:MAG TPA: YiiX/YebB-like N1pC/P60 family cysteine hydrolase [Candidatus Krumholzibacteria bacterium]
MVKGRSGGPSAPASRRAALIDREELFASAKKLLKPGDILLSQGVDETSQAIMTLDGGVYSHAGIWSGHGVIESTTPCVAESPLDVCLSEHPRAVVDVYRHRARRSGQRVVEMARRYLGRPYSYGDLLLGALLIVGSKVFPQDRNQIAFLTYGSKLNDFLDLDDEVVSELVTCVELVVRAHENAGIPIRIEVTAGGYLDLDVLTAGIARFTVDSKSRAPTSRGLRGAWARVQRKFAAKLARAAVVERLEMSASRRRPPPQARAQRTRARARARLLEAGLEWGANLVTPRHLADSPDLEFRGRLYEARPATRRPA